MGISALHFELLLTVVRYNLRSKSGGIMDSRWCRIPSIRSSPSPRASPARPRNVNFAASSVSFLPSVFYSDLPRCSTRPSASARPSVRQCGNGADFSSFEVRLLPAATAASAVCAASVVAASASGQTWFRSRLLFSSTELRTSEADTRSICSADGDRRRRRPTNDRARERSTAGEGHNEFFSAFLPSF